MTTLSLFDRILRAHSAIRPRVCITPLERSRSLSAALGCEVLLKANHLQPTGSFKIRDATNEIHLLGESARSTGVITASIGNHGQAVARAGSLAAVPVTVYVAATTVPAKTEAIRGWGAKLFVVEGNPLDGELQARRVLCGRNISLETFLDAIGNTVR